MVKLRTREKFSREKVGKEKSWGPGRGGGKDNGCLARILTSAIYSHKLHSVIIKFVSRKMDKWILRLIHFSKISGFPGNPRIPGNGQYSKSETTCNELINNITNENHKQISNSNN